MAIQEFSKNYLDILVVPIFSIFRDITSCRTKCYI